MTEPSEAAGRGPVDAEGALRAKAPIASRIADAREALHEAMRDAVRVEGTEVKLAGLRLTMFMDSERAEKFAALIRDRLHYTVSAALALPGEARPSVGAGGAPDGATNEATALVAAWQKRTRLMTLPGRDDLIATIAAALSEAPPRPVVGAEEGALRAQTLAREIVAAIMAACDEHGPIAPAYSERIVEPILAAALSESPPRPQGADLAEALRPCYTLRGSLNDRCLQHTDDSHGSRASYDICEARSRLIFKILASLSGAAGPPQEPGAR